MSSKALKLENDCRRGTILFLAFFLACFSVAFFVFAIEAKAYSDPNAKTCQLNYKICADNAQLVDQWDDLLSIRNACEIAASDEIRSRTGTLPNWHSAINGGSFPSYLMGKSGPLEGKITLLDDHVQAADAYGITAERHVTCEVDLESRKILNIRYK